MEFTKFVIVLYIFDVSMPRHLGCLLLYYLHVGYYTQLWPFPRRNKDPVCRNLYLLIHAAAKPPPPPVMSRHNLKPLLEASHFISDELLSARERKRERYLLQFTRILNHRNSKMRSVKIHPSDSMEKRVI